MKLPALLVLAAAATFASAQQYRGEVLPPYMREVRLTAACGGLVAGMNVNSWYGAAWLDGSFRYLDAFGVVNATDGRRVGGNRGTGLATLVDLESMRMIDLHPPGFPGWSSDVLDMDGEYQVGVVQNFFPQHAVLWRGTAASAKVLTPQGYSDSAAITIDGGDIYGAVVFGSRLQLPCVWRDYGAEVEVYGSLASFEYVRQSRNGVQVGYRTPANNRQRPMLWRGWPHGPIDLSPPNLRKGEALATNGAVQVGWVSFTYTPQYIFDGASRAALWRGSRESYFDLHRLLPPIFDSSQAVAVTSDGTIFGNAASRPAYRPVPVVWRPMR